MSDDELGVALLESLQRANPVPVGEPGGRRDLPSAHALFAEITAQRPRRVRRRTMVIAVALLILLVASLIGAFALLNSDEPTVLGAVVCAPNAIYPIDHGWLAPSGGDPIAACEEPWDNGVFGTDGSSSGLDACVLPTGAVGVFPGEFGSVCRQKLNLPPAHLNADIAKLEEFRKATANAVRENCIDYDAARAIVEQKFSQYGYTGWVVAQNPAAPTYSDDEPCSSVATVFDHHLVYIEAIGPAYPGQPVPGTPR
jgi:hypothetical protein